MATSYQIRPFTGDEFSAFLVVDQHAFNEPPWPERGVANLLARVELDRTLGAFDGEAVAGGTGVFSFQMRVPGAMAAVAGVSIVAVLPTHRRRGILSALMRRQLADIRERGEAVAALFASEAGIYGRYGYGSASWHANYTLHAGEGALAARAPSDPALRLRIAEPQSARSELAKVYELVLAERPGMFARSEPWWERLMPIQDSDGPAAKPVRCLLAEDDSGLRGYALYTAKGQWDEGTSLPGGRVDVHEAMTTGPATTAALWENLLTRDLVTEFHAWMRPVDDPLPFLLADPRRVRSRVSDNLWVRLLDVGTALAQRRYACPVDVVIEVADGLCPQNEGRWRLTAAAATAAAAAPAGFGATCERTTAPADVVMPVRALGAAYLGGTRLGTMAGAGLVTEATAGSLAALSTAMSWEPAPLCPMIF
jgi:predicted acetyltransferase